MKKFFHVVVSIFILPVGLAGLPALGHASDSTHSHQKHEIHWGYKGEGAPDKWGSLKPDYELCGKGQQQSPINIEGPSKGGNVGPIAFSYSASPLKVLNNGHTIQANYQPGSSIRIGEETYNLLQLHFHSPSEHLVKGASSNMEAHLVHKNDKGQLAVVGVMIKEGKANSNIQAIWDNIPQEVNKEKTVDGATLNAANLLPQDKSYYHYKGSLTTPPCSEGVRWFVLKTHMEASAEQITKFLSVVHENARPAQPLQGRSIVEAQ